MCGPSRRTARRAGTPRRKNTAAWTSIPTRARACRFSCSNVMPGADDYAVVVGINDYSPPPFGPLNGPVNDAQDFIAWLKAPEGAGLPASHVDPYVELSDATVPRPTWSHVQQALNRVLNLAPADPAQSRIGRRIYIFLAGHGLSPDLNDTYLVT